MAKTYWSDITDHKNYNKHSGALGKKFITALLREGESVLDVGCGSGILWEQIKTYINSYPHIYKGVDITDEFIKVCKELYPETEWEVQDARHLQEANESWDTVVNYHMIELAGPDYKKVINEGLRVAKKRFIVVFWKGLSHNPENIYKPMADGIEYETTFSASEWFKFLHEIEWEYAPWLEFWTDESRYNLYFIFDKEYKRIESGQGMDYLTQK